MFSRLHYWTAAALFTERLLILVLSLFLSFSLSMFLFLSLSCSLPLFLSLSRSLFHSILLYFTSVPLSLSLFLILSPSLLLFSPCFSLSPFLYQSVDISMPGLVAFGPIAHACAYTLVAYVHSTLHVNRKKNNTTNETRTGRGAFRFPRFWLATK